MKSFIKGLSKFALCLTVVFMTLSIGLATESPSNYVYAAEGDVEVDETNFPDAKFRQVVLNITGGSTTLTAEKIANTRYIDVANKSIADLKGIEYFTKLGKLVCNNNSLTTLDVSKNTELSHLECDSNSLTSLDVSNNPDLQYLHCNSNKLATLDVSRNPLLEKLYCVDNQLTTLDVSNNTALVIMCCNDNLLATLDVSKNTKLTELTCWKNLLTTLNVSNNPALTNLACGDNKLLTLDVSSSTSLRMLVCSSNLLTALDLSNNRALESLLCVDNPLTALDLSNNPALKTLDCYSNKLTALDLSKNNELVSAYVKLSSNDDNQPAHQTPAFVAKKVGNKYVVNLKQNDTTLKTANISELVSKGTYDSVAATITYDTKPAATETITYEYNTDLPDVESLIINGSITIDNGTVTNTGDNNGNHTILNFLNRSVRNGSVY